MYVHLSTSGVPLANSGLVSSLEEDLGLTGTQYQTCVSSSLLPLARYRRATHHIRSPFCRLHSDGNSIEYAYHSHSPLTVPVLCHDAVVVSIQLVAEL